MAGRRRGGLRPGIWLSLVLCISPALARQDRPDAVLFYSAALAEARLPEQGGSAEDFQNFYAKTKDMEVDRDLIEKLRLAQQEIDSGEEAVTGSGVEAAEGGDLLQDFTLRKALFGESNERLVEARISCFSCDAPNCTASHVSRDCSACYTAQVRDTDGEEERSKGCVASTPYPAARRSSVTTPRPGPSYPPCPVSSPSRWTGRGGGGAATLPGWCWLWSAPWPCWASWSPSYWPSCGTGIGSAWQSSTQSTPSRTRTSWWGCTPGQRATRHCGRYLTRA